MPTILISVALSLATIFGVYNYVPANLLQLPSFSQPKLGSTITTILGTDTLSASRTTINTNFSNLNTDKLQSGDTASTLTITTGTIGTLTLTNPLTVPYGGTASTTLSSNQILLGNGTSLVKTVSGWGSSGQFLTSNGGVLAPTWQTGAIDQTANYAWTGTHSFSNTLTISGATTHSGTVALNATTTNAANMVNTNTVNAFTAGDTITLSSNLPKPVSFATTTANVFLSDGNVASTTNFMGFAVTSAALNSTVYVQTDGIVGGFSGLTAGAKYYVSDTVGTLGAANTAGTSQIYVGVAVSATQIYLDKANSSWQYLSSASASGTVTVPAYTNYIIINATGVTSATPADTANGEVFLTRFGKTTGSIIVGTEAGATDTSSGYSASWNTTTDVLTITVSNSSLSGTVYFYR